MKRVLLSVFTVLLSLAFLPGEADAKRLGGGGTSGMKRQTPPPQQAPTVPAKPAATPAATPGAAAAAPGAAAAAAPKRSWMGPIAGLAAGLGLAALMSHLGMGAEMANFMMMALMAVAAFFLIRFLMRRFGPQRNAAPQGLQFAGAGAGAGANFQGQEPVRPAPASFGSGSAASVAAPVVAAAAVSTLPEGFDAPAFERIAKLIFIRMQAANDANDLEDLRQFATPEMFATFKLDLQDRKGAAQQTDVVQLDAQVLDFAQEPERQVVSVRFHGLVREVKDAVAEPFDEIWHLVKPTDGSREWAIAGIAQSPTA